MKLENKVAVIAGGTKGIGLGIALEFAREGARVVVGGTNPKNGETAESEIAAAGGDGLFVKCDVSNLDDLDNIISETVERYGRVDIYEQMVAQGDGGVIINMSSVNAHLALDSQVVYTVSKGGIQQLTKVQAVALAPHNIKVNAMAPGPIETDLMRRVGSDKELMDTILSRTPQGRIGTPRECGRLAVFLASDDSDFIFGQSIYIDGGRGFQAFPTPGYRTVTEEDYEKLQALLADS
jgi:NAD(P)-dependent dehydrogenase (short-subunit alcohol dehydrogenase family)